MAGRNSSLVLIALVAVFGMPIATSWLLVFNPQWLPAGRVNYGELIEPAVPTGFKGSWTVLVPFEKSCDDQCRRVQTVVQVVQRALGAEGRRVQGPADCRWKGPCADLAAAVGKQAALVVVDPMGNAMLRYGPEVAPRDLLKDMQRLLKASRDWSYDGV